MPEIARAVGGEVRDRRTPEGIFRGYLALGLLEEAGTFLETKVQTGEMSAKEAIPLYEALIGEFSRSVDPVDLRSVCESAFRAGIRSPAVLYGYATALRLEGSRSEARRALQEIGEDSPWYPFAGFALGQMSVEEGDRTEALSRFERIRALGGAGPGGNLAAALATRAQALLLFLSGRTGEGKSLLRAAEGSGRSGGIASLLAEVAQDLPPGRWGEGSAAASLSREERILLRLLGGRKALELGDGPEAIRLAEEAMEELRRIRDRSPGEGEGPPREDRREEALKELMDRHRSTRGKVQDGIEGSERETFRSAIVEFQVELLLMDQQLLRLERKEAGIGKGFPSRLLSDSGADAILDRIERAYLDGRDVETVYDDLSRNLEVLQNLAHPIRRYRSLIQLEKSHKALEEIREKIAEQREGAASRLGSEAGGDGGLFLEEVGRFLEELDRFRTSAAEASAFSRERLNVFRDSGSDRSGDERPLVPLAEEVLAFDAELVSEAMPRIQEVRERERAARRERERGHLLDLYPVAARQLAESFCARMRALRETRSEGWPVEARSLLHRALTLLDDPGIPRDGKEEIALRVGAVLLERQAEWNPFPFREEGGEWYAGIPERLLPHLPLDGKGDPWQEPARFLATLLHLQAGSPEGIRMAGEYMGSYPLSPRVGEIALRLGHAELLGRRDRKAEALYERASASPRGAVRDTGLVMLAWFGMQRGEAGEAVTRVSGLLEDPDSSCEALSPVASRALSLAVRGWRDLPLIGLAEYPPVRRGGCVGKLLLEGLAREEWRLGRFARSSEAYELLASRYRTDPAAFSYGMESVRALARSGRRKEALERAFALQEDLGPGSPRWEERDDEGRARDRNEFRELLRGLSGQEFEEGVRTGSVPSMALAEAGLKRFFSLTGEERTEREDELRVQWAFASLRTGNREAGKSILRELIRETGDRELRSRAVLLYAETMVAGFEKELESAEETEEAVLWLLEGETSEKAVSLALRGATDFLARGEPARAARVAGAIGESGSASPGQAYEAGLVRAEAWMEYGDPAAARGATDRLLRKGAPEGMSRQSSRAKDLHLLASLRIAEEKAIEGEWREAAILLEELAGRFSDTREEADYLLQANRGYRNAGDAEGILRTANRFLERHPGNEAVFEVAGTSGAILEERKELRSASDLYARAAAASPKRPEVPNFLFASARLARDLGDRDLARKRFAVLRDAQSTPRWMNAYARLSLGLILREEGDSERALGILSDALQRSEKGVEPEAPADYFRILGEGYLSVGDFWEDQFRKVPLTVPLEKSVAVKERFFRKALQAYGKSGETGGRDSLLRSYRKSGDLFLEFARAILDSERPRKMEPDRKEKYEQSLSEQAEELLNRSIEWYLSALDRIDPEDESGEIAGPLRERLEEAQRMLARTQTGEISE